VQDHRRQQFRNELEGGQAIPYLEIPEDLREYCDRKYGDVIDRDDTTLSYVYLGQACKASSAAATATRKATILPNGKTLAQEGGSKAAPTKMATILPNGNSLAKETGMKAAATATSMIRPDGLSNAQHGARMAAATKSATFLPSARTIAQEGASKIDEAVNWLATSSRVHAS
jgi:hypothetical protein